MTTILKDEKFFAAIGSPLDDSIDNLPDFLCGVMLRNCIACISAMEEAPDEIANVFGIFLRPYVIILPVNANVAQFAVHPLEPLRRFSSRVLGDELIP
jgi:hypothetical protein